MHSSIFILHQTNQPVLHVLHCSTTCSVYFIYAEDSTLRQQALAHLADHTSQLIRLTLRQRHVVLDSQCLGDRGELREKKCQQTARLWTWVYCLARLLAPAVSVNGDVRRCQPEGYRALKHARVGAQNVARQWQCGIAPAFVRWATSPHRRIALCTVHPSAPSVSHTAHAGCGKARVGPIPAALRDLGFRIVWRMCDRNDRACRARHSPHAIPALHQGPHTTPLTATSTVCCCPHTRYSPW